MDLAKALRFIKSSPFEATNLPIIQFFIFRCVNLAEQRELPGDEVGQIHAILVTPVGSRPMAMALSRNALACELEGQETVGNPALMLAH